MSNSIEFIYDRNSAIELVRSRLTDQHFEICKEAELNDGKAYKFYLKKMGLIVYFKGENSSKLVFENVSEQIKTLFNFKNEDIENDSEPTNLEIRTIPIHSPIKIDSKEKQTQIKENLLTAFEDVEVNYPSEIITYALHIKKDKYKFTVTQFNTGTLLLQGLSTPLFEDILHIIQKINPLSVVENSLLFVPEKEQKTMQHAFKEEPDIFSGIYDKAAQRVSKEAFDYLFPNEQQLLASAIAILELVKEKELIIPLYNPILYPFAKVFEGFIIKLMLDKKFFSFDDYKLNPEVADIGNALRKKKFKKYIKDVCRNEGILDKLATTWESIRCHELHSDPAQESEIINLTDIVQVENRIGEISAVIMDGYRVLVKNGYTEEEMLENKKNS